MIRTRVELIDYLSAKRGEIRGTVARQWKASIPISDIHPDLARRLDRGFINLHYLSVVAPYFITVPVFKGGDVYELGVNEGNFWLLWSQSTGAPLYRCPLNDEPPTQGC